MNIIFEEEIKVIETNKFSSDCKFSTIKQELCKLWNLDPRFYVLESNDVMPSSEFMLKDFENISEISFELKSRKSISLILIMSNNTEEELIISMNYKIQDIRSILIQNQLKNAECKDSGKS